MGCWAGEVEADGDAGDGADDIVLLSVRRSLSKRSRSPSKDVCAFFNRNVLVCRQGSGQG